MTPTPAQIEAALDTFNHCMEKAQNRRQAITAALAAAEVVDDGGPITYKAIDIIRNTAIAATIERCAQVAESYNAVPDSFGYETKMAIAAAIRALKNK